MSDTDRLLILTRNSARIARRIGEKGIPDLELISREHSAEVFKGVETCNMILGEPTLVADVVNAASRLKWVQSTFAGVEPLMRPGLRKDYLLTNVKDVFGPMMREYVFGYIIAMERHFFQTIQNQRNKVWKSTRYRTLKNLTLGVCGVGSIGGEVALTAKHFGMTVWGFRKSGVPIEWVDRMFSGSGFYEFLSFPDYVVVTLPHTPETDRLFDESAFQAMKPSSVLINVGRGKVVKESAMITALQAGHIRGAVLDVFDQEPLPENSPLWNLDQVIITPHNSAYSFSKDITEVFIENYRLLKAGKALKFRVDFEKGY
jgi:phosphoglycerate dehydrogenase-like enzyme